MTKVCDHPSRMTAKYIVHWDLYVYLLWIFLLATQVLGQNYGYKVQQADIHFKLDNGTEKGVFNGAYRFPSNSRYLTLPPYDDPCLLDFLNCSHGWSMTFWLKLYNFSLQDSYVVSNLRPSTNVGVAVRIVKQTIKFETRGQVSYICEIPESYLHPLGSWHFLTMAMAPRGISFTCDTDFKEGFVGEKGTAVRAISSANTSTQLSIGGNHLSKEACQCAIDDIQIWLTYFDDTTHFANVYNTGLVRVFLTQRPLGTHRPMPMYFEDNDPKTCSALKSDVLSIKDTFVEIEWDTKPIVMTQTPNYITLELTGFALLDKVLMFVGGPPGDCFQIVQCETVGGTAEYLPAFGLEQKSTYICDCRLKGCTSVYMALREICLSGVDCLTVLVCHVNTIN